MPSKGAQVRAWCFTINNPGSVDPYQWPWSYLIYQEEIGENGTQHIQGYVIMKVKTTMAGMKKLAPTAHFEQRNGTHEQARHYCLKPVEGCACEHCTKAREGPPKMAGPFEYGEAPRPGERTDLLEVRDMVLQGASKRSLWADHFPTMAKYHAAIDKYRLIVTPKRDFKSQVAVLYGPTGTGKTRFIVDNINQEKAFWMDSARTTGNPWVDGYDPMEHKHLVIDEFYGWIKWNTLLRLLDRYPFTLETKGGTLQMRPKYIWITSNSPPVEWYNFEESKGRMEFATLLRRLNVVWEFKKEDDGSVTIVKHREDFEGVELSHQPSEEDQEMDTIRADLNQVDQAEQVDHVDFEVPMLEDLDY